MLRLIQLLTLLAAALAAQTPRPSFEAASVKPNHSGDQRTVSNFRQPGNRVTITNTSLDFLIALAYSLPIVQTSGWPKWIYSARYDIEAVAEGNPAPDQKILMLQSLLADRFKLVIRRETQQRPVYALMLVKQGKLGPKLHPHSGSSPCRDITAPVPPPDQPMTALCGGFGLRPGHLVAQGIALSDLGRVYNGQLGRFVIDRTGLTGTFDLSLDDFAPPAADIAPDAEPANPSGLPSYFTAFREQLGLKFESTTGPVEMYLIDHVEMPSEN